MKLIVIAAAAAALLASPCSAQQLGFNSQGTLLRAAPNAAAAQKTVAATAVEVAPQRDTRQEVTIQLSTANGCAVGFTPAVSMTTGFLLPAAVGANVVIRSKAPVYMVCSASSLVSVLDAY